MRSTFRVHSLQLYDNPIFDNVNINFYDLRDEKSKMWNEVSELYSTIVIGPNGTGKSNLLRILILLFSELSDLLRSGSRSSKVKGLFHLQYSLDGKSYQYSNFDANLPTFKRERRPIILCDGHEIPYQEIQIPEAVIAMSIMLTDKFPVDLPEFSNYTYLGVKANASTARTTTFVRKTVDLLFSALGDQSVYENISTALEFLGYQKELYVSYYPKYKHIFFNGNLNEHSFESFFSVFWEHTKRPQNNPPWTLSVFNELKEKSPGKIVRLVNLCNKLSQNLEYEYEGSRTQYFEFNVFKNYLSQDEVKDIRDLHALDIISYPSIGFVKNNKMFQLTDSSSGEYHFISSFIGLLAKVKQNSLILIDEPENSLHPTWQMKYISFFKQIFRKYKSCHLIVTSHSHFIISDLKPRTSNIIGLLKADQITAESIPSNTYGWSAEEILTNIFHTASSRNYYLTEQLGEIFELISQEPDERNVPEIKKRISELKKIDLSGLNIEDPLYDVIQKLYKKF